jgi:hypothetical protein
MEARDLLMDAFGRIEEAFAEVATGLDPATLRLRPEGTAGGDAGRRGNSIAWLLWHVSRGQDAQVAGLAGTGQVWHEGWHDTFGLPIDPGDTGYGHTSEQVDALGEARLEDLVGYHADVHRRTTAYLERVDAEELDRVIDTRWDPPVTVGVRLVSIEGDCLQHLGQAAYVKGLYSSGSTSA